MQYAVVEEASYTEQVARLGSTRRIDEVTSAIIWALGNDPYQFPELRRFPGFRVASTVPCASEGIYVPALRVLFRVHDSVVHLLAISPVMPEEDEGEDAL